MIDIRLLHTYDLLLDSIDKQLAAEEYPMEVDKLLEERKSIQFERDKYLEMGWRAILAGA